MTTPFYAGSAATAAAVDAALPQNYVLAVDQTMTTGGDQLIGNFVTNALPVGTYVFQISLNYTANASSGTPEFAFHGPSGSTLQQIAAVIGTVGTQATWVFNGSGGGFTSVGMTNTFQYNVTATYTVTTTAVGTISFQAHASANTFTISAGAAMTVMSATLS